MHCESRLGHTSVLELAIYIQRLYTAHHKHPVAPRDVYSWYIPPRRPGCGVIWGRPEGLSQSDDAGHCRTPAKLSKFTTLRFSSSLFESFQSTESQKISSTEDTAWKLHWQAVRYDNYNYEQTLEWT